MIPSLNLWRLPASSLLAAALLAACATQPLPPAPPPDTATMLKAELLKPNADLLVQGVPDIPMSLVRSVEKYTDFRGHSFADWHPTRREMLVRHRRAGGNTVQLYRLGAPLAAAEALTDLPDPVSSAHYEPQEGRYIVFGQSRGGNEATQLYRLDPPTRQITLLTSPDQRHSMGPWLKQRGLAVVTSLPLDRTAVGGTRAAVTTTLWLMDALKPGARQVLAELPGPGWIPAAVSPDERWLALALYVSATESQTWLMDLGNGQRRRLLPLPDAKESVATYLPADFSADGRALYVVSDRAGEFRELHQVDLASGNLTRVTGHIPWDIGGGTRTGDGRWLALQANVDGRDELRLFDGVALKEVPAPGLPGGSIGSTQFHPSRADLAFSINSARGPGQIYSLDPASGRIEQWTRSTTAPGIEPAQFGEQAIVRWPSFDGRTISGLISRPPARFAGKRPVLIDIHGGPESQASVGFIGRNQYYVQELGIAMIRPNVRGSSGYGKSFVSLDNGRLREDSVKDIGALLDWVASQPDLDASRVMVSGGSYGGYMSLAVAAHYAPRIAGAIDVVGISNFVTFLQNTESYRRDLRRVEYGDERDPAMRSFLEVISPLNQAHRITKPLFVVQGRNDPRVPYTEAEQIVAQVRANGTPVWYLRAENEGHGFARKENADYQFYATIVFMQQTLLR